MCCANTERPRPTVVGAVRARQRKRDDVGQDQIGLVVNEKPGRQLYRIAIVRWVSPGISGVGTGASRADHGSRELINHNARIGLDLAAVSRYVTLTVDPPTILVSAVVPERKRNAGTLVFGVGVDQPSALRPT